MSRRFGIVAIFLGFAACATSGPETPATNATGEAATINSNPAATDGESVTNNASQTEGEIQVMDIPEVAFTAGPVAAPEVNYVVCRKERATGSHISKRVCRTRAEIEQRRQEDQHMLDKLKRIPAQ